MPSIKVQYRHPVGAISVSVLAEELPKIVAEALTCEHPDGHLAPEDIEIEFVKMGEGFRTRYHLQIIVEANEYPERLINLDERQARIKHAVRALFTGCFFLHEGKAFVWVRLCPGSFGEF